MKKKYKVVVGSVAVFIIVVGFSGYISFAAGVLPGSNSDPLVTKSYVDNKINQSLSGQTPIVALSTDEVVSDVMAQIKFLYGDQLRANASQGQSSVQPTVNVPSYVPVSGTKGQTILGHEGTEIILRSGEAVGHCPGKNILINTTDGKEILNNSKISINNLIIVPRKDGRGVKITKDAWFVIKGGYDIVN